MVGNGQRLKKMKRNVERKHGYRKVHQSPQCQGLGQGPQLNAQKKIINIETHIYIHDYVRNRNTWMLYITHKPVESNILLNITVKLYISKAKYVCVLNSEIINVSAKEIYPLQESFE